jgi:two-component system, cell cycle sensor histidine kinase and response regulator CckA
VYSEKREVVPVMKIPLKVLVVEDSRDDAELLVYALKHAGYDPSYALVQNAQGMNAQLGKADWDLVISDYVIPGFGGMAALKVLRDSGRDIPFIIVSGKIGEDVAVEALHSGANDYLLKDRLTRLGPAIDRVLKEASHKRKRAQAELALRESEERYRRLVESCPDAMFIASEGKVVFANPAAVSLLGAQTPVDLIGKSFLDFVDRNFRDLVEEHLRQALEGLDGPLLEQKMIRADGNGVLVEAIARRIQYHGDPAVQVICRDISSRKHLEQQLLNANKMEAIARLAGGVANDFNNLLTVITGYTGLIRSGLEPDHPLQKDLQQVFQSTERAIGLTNQLLAISRKDVAAPEALNLNTVIEQLLPLLRRLLGDSIEPVAYLTEAACNIRADRGQLETLIINLAVHARDSMSHGGSFEIKTENFSLLKPLHDNVHLRAGDYVSLTLSDTGLGLSEEYQEHLFEPFFGSAQPGKNTGLGLATVYAIVKQHGGQISCTSEVGKGSTFKIFLPACKAPPPQSVVPSRPTMVTDQPAVILLAEDEEVLREFANLILRKHGFHVLTARDGIEALKVAEQYSGPLDVLFTDVVMPRMGGAELFRRFTEKRPNTPVIFTSGYPRSILVESGLEDNDGYQFLQKPYTTQTLLEKIRSVLAFQRSGTPASI